MPGPGFEPESPAIRYRNVGENLCWHDIKWLLSLPSKAPTIKYFKRLRPGLIHQDHLINRKLISALSIHLTLLKIRNRVYKF